MDPGLRELSPQTALHPQKPGRGRITPGRRPVRVPAQAHRRQKNSYALTPEEKIRVSRQSGRTLTPHGKKNRAEKSDRLLEPILSVGYRPVGGILVLEYLPDQMVRFQWMRVGHEPIISSPVPLAPDLVRKIEVSLGSLFPPAESPLWPKDTRAHSAERKNTVSVHVDGQPVLAVQINTPDISPVEIVVAQNQLGMSGVSERFSGELISVNRKAW